MNLIFLKHIKRNARSSFLENPYLLKMRYEGLKNNILNRFIDVLNPFFAGNTVNPEDSSAIDTLRAGDQENTYEWDMGQDSLSLLRKDLLFMLHSLLPCPIRQIFLSLAVYLDVYLRMDEEVQISSSLISTYDKGYKNGHMIRLTADHNLLTRSPYGQKVVAWWNLLCEYRTHSALRGLESIKFPVPLGCPGYGLKVLYKILIPYMIRGPAFIKNLLLFYSNKRN